MSSSVSDLDLGIASCSSGLMPVHFYLGLYSYLEEGIHSSTSPLFWNVQAPCPRSVCWVYLSLGRGQDHMNLDPNLDCWLSQSDSCMMSFSDWIALIHCLAWGFIQSQRWRSDTSWTYLQEGPLSSMGYLPRFYVWVFEALVVGSYRWSSERQEAPEKTANWIVDSVR